jgi:hypothetical protein
MDDFEQDSRSGYAYLGGYLEIDRRAFRATATILRNPQAPMNAAQRWRVS